MKRAPVIASVPDDFDPTAIATAAPAAIGHNQSPFDAISQEINDLFDEAKNFADGDPITSPEMHDAIERLRTSIHEAGKRADALRVEEKKPLDEQVAAVQAKFNPLIQPKRGRVDMAKAALDDLLTPWRQKVAAEKAAEAARVAAAAEAARVAAQEAIRASSGNLAAREEAEELLADAKALERGARRADKAATVGTGLRTVWIATLVDEDAAMEWAWARAKAEILAVAQRNAEEAVRAGARQIPGFSIRDEKRAA
ncbi:hypothetical protein EHH54_39390 [Rhizobium leguminosarum]|uniref:hypothetical protein n=1 Tax=Rhizobium leguminosarum TaxID=384 RepID=UPI000FEC52D5|nr:hypothetical protein [Rhizobium leguminosarum]RWX22159.1 hypothetical protein EHH54_39390 [Rhizobium leguminosarum]